MQPNKLSKIGRVHVLASAEYRQTHFHVPPVTFHFVSIIPVFYLRTPMNGSRFDVNIHVYLSCGMTSSSRRQLMFPVRSSLL